MGAEATGAPADRKERSGRRRSFHRACNVAAQALDAWYLVVDGYADEAQPEAVRLLLSPYARTGVNPQVYIPQSCLPIPFIGKIP